MTGTTIVLDWDAPEVKNLSPIPCRGHWIHTQDGSDSDCGYEHSVGFGCEDCIVNGGRFDPRTGKRYRKVTVKP
jgi:hypothetical protein